MVVSIIIACFEYIGPVYCKINVLFAMDGRKTLVIYYVKLDIYSTIKLYFGER